jgi:hypothetical protein
LEADLGQASGRVGPQLGQAAVEPVDVLLLGGPRIRDRPSVSHGPCLGQLPSGLVKKASRTSGARSRLPVAQVLSADVVRPFRVTAPQPPGHDWQRRLIVLVIAFVACAGLLATSHVGGTATTAAQRGPRTTTVAPPSIAAPTTTTTVDPKAISAGVAALLSHEGPSAQEVASAPSSARSGGGGRHAKSSGVRLRK